MSPPPEVGGAAVAAVPPASRVTAGRLGGPLGVGVATLYLSLIVLIPLAALAYRAVEDGGGSFWDAVSSDRALAALRLTFLLALAVVLVNAVMGTLIAWVLVRDRFPGRRLVNSLIDLPFALPTIVAGLTLIALYGAGGPLEGLGVNLTYTNLGVALALLLSTLPFVVRSVQPVLMELDPETEEAAASLGAGQWTTFRRVILPSLLPSVIGGSGLAFSKALGEYGAIVLIAGNVPQQSELASVFIFGQIEQDRPGAAAAVSVVLLTASLVALVGLTVLERYTSRHER